MVSTCRDSKQERGISPKKRPALREQGQPFVEMRDIPALSTIQIYPLISRYIRIPSGNILVVIS